MTNVNIMTNETTPRKILSLKKKPVEVIDPQIVKSQPNIVKINGPLKQRLEVHAKATSDLKKTKHPIRIACLVKMLIRLNVAIAKINSLTVSYDESGKQILTPV